MTKEIIVYTATWCKKCKLLKTELLDELQKNTTDFIWSFIDVDEIDDGPDRIPYITVKNDNNITNFIGYNEIIQSLEMSLIY